MSYTQTRFNLDQKRTLVWQVFAPYLQNRFFNKAESVLDIGCGYGDFINNIKASQKAATDLRSDYKSFLAADVDFKICSVESLTQHFHKESFDVIFSSNLLEHLERKTIDQLFQDCFSLLKPQGLLCIFMPNYAKAYKEYFDDYTHITAISDRALCDWLRAFGYQIEFCHPGFMPFSVKDSKMPVYPLLVRLWLSSPFKPGKQMLVVARKGQA